VAAKLRNFGRHTGTGQVSEMLSPTWLMRMRMMMRMKCSENHKMDIARRPIPSGWSMCDIGFVTLGQTITRKMIQKMWMSFAQCEYSIHTSLGDCEIAQIVGRHTDNHKMDIAHRPIRVAGRCAI
jgi:hypothetical protein